MGLLRRSIGVGFVALFTADPASACFETSTTPKPWVWMTSATTAQVALEGFVVEAGDIDPGEFCAVGFGHSNTLITSISALTVKDDADPDGSPVPLPGLAFAPNATTTADLTAAVPTSTWQGFHVTAGAVIPAATQAALVFTINFPAATNYQDIVAELQDFDFVGLSDALIGGGLTGTLEVEGIVGSADLPYCYDDIQQGWEFCDAASDLGCGGLSCIDCSQCLPGNPANECKSRILRDLAYAEKGQLKCYAREAKNGQPVIPSCLTDVRDVNTLWLKYVLSCPQILPAAATVQAYVDGVGAALVPVLPLGVTTGSYKCAANKFKAASLKAVTRTKCYSKAYQISQPVDPLCLTRSDSKFQNKFARAELPGLCDPGNLGNATAVANLVDQFVSDILLAIPPP